MNNLHTSYKIYLSIIEPYAKKLVNQSVPLKKVNLKISQPFTFLEWFCLLSFSIGKEVMEVMTGSGKVMQEYKSINYVRRETTHSSETLRVK